MTGEIKISRSFSKKITTKQYENEQFYCFLEATCSREMIEETSESLIEECMRQVMKDIEKREKEIAEEIESKKPKYTPSPTQKITPNFKPLKQQVEEQDGAIAQDDLDEPIITQEV